MKTITNISIILMTVISCNSQESKSNTWNHHVHIFSQNLLTDLRGEKSGSELIQGPDYLYSNIDTIMSKVIADNIALISTGYGYKKELKSQEELASLIKYENDNLLEAYKKYKDRIFPFIGIDPTESYAIEEVKRCNKLFDKFGIKLHFHSSKIELLNPNEIKIIKPIFDYAIVENIPLLIHFKNHQDDFGEKHINSFFDNLISPKNPLTIIFAHTGGDGIINSKTEETVRTILRLNKEYKQNIFFEISTAIWSKYIKQYEIEDDKKQELINEIGINRILYGTDYPAREFKSYYNLLKYRLKFTDGELNTIRTNSPLNEYAR